VNDHSERLTGWLASIGVHLLLGLAFLLTHLELKPFDLDFTLVFFVPLEEPTLGGGEPEREWGGEEPLVELPRRPMLDETSPLLKLPERQKPAVAAPIPQGKPDLTKVEALRPGVRAPLPLPGEERVRAAIKPLPINDEALFGQRSDVVGEKIASEEMFTIKWEGGPTRVKTSGRLPEFPRSVNRAVKIRLAFTVAPDGSVVSITPQTKGEPELEKVSVDALRTWRFNPLPQGAARQNQNGVITFVFELK